MNIIFKLRLDDALGKWWYFGPLGIDVVIKISDILIWMF